MYGSLGNVEFRLADWLPEDEQYQRRYIPVDPQTEYVAAERFGLTSDLQTRVWFIRDWSGGEGEYVWDRELKSFRDSDGVKPVLLDEGIELGPARSETNDTTGSALFDDSGALGYGQGYLWTAYDTHAYYWDDNNSKWSDGYTTGSSAQCMSIADGQDTWMYSADTNCDIYRWKSGSSSVWHTTAGSLDAPVLVNFEDTLYMLQGNDLYSVDKTVQDTDTLKVDTNSGDFGSVNWANKRHRMWTSDVGPIWITETDDFQSFVWEYNVANDTGSKIAKLPDFVHAATIFYVKGFVFVGYGDSSGDAYLWYGRGAQQGIVGPLPSGAGGSALFGGLIGNELVVVSGTKVLGYNLSTGAIINHGSLASVSGFDTARLFYSRLLIGDCDGPTTSHSAAIYDWYEYHTSGDLYTGWFDFDYPAMEKILLDVTVTTDPLPANTKVSLAYATDGDDTYTALTGDHDTDDATTFTWTISSNSATVTAKTVEWKITLASTDSTETPVVRELSSRATGGAHRLEWTFAVDCTVVKSGKQESSVIIDSLNTLATNKTVVQLSDPWQNRDSEAADTFDVTIEEVITPQVHGSDPPVAYVRVRTVSLV